MVLRIYNSPQRRVILLQDNIQVISATTKPHQIIIHAVPNNGAQISTIQA